MAIKVKPIGSPEVYKQGWCHCPGWTVYHSPAWLEFLAEMGSGQTLMLGFYESGRIVGFLPGKLFDIGPLNLFGSPMPGWTTDYMGPIFLQQVDPDECSNAIIDFAQEYGIHHIEMVSRNGLFSPVTGWSSETAYTYIADLSKDPEALLGSFQKSCRKSIQRAVREGDMEVEFTEEEEFIPTFYGQLIEVFERQGLKPTYSINRLESLWSHLKPGKRLLTSWARLNGKPIATRIDLVGNGTLHSFGSASSQKFLGHHANEYLRYFVMISAAQQGLSQFDMSGGGSYKGKFNAVRTPQSRLIWSPAWLRAGRKALKQLSRLRAFSWMFTGLTVQGAPPAKRPCGHELIPA